VAIERGIDFSFNELRYSSISLEIPLAAASGPTQSISICLTWFRRASLETFVCALSFSIFFDNSTVAFHNSSSASPTSQRIIMTLVISSLPIEILVFGLRFLINDKQQQTYNTSAWYPPAPTSNAPSPPLGADVVLNDDRLHKLDQVLTPRNAALMRSLTLRLTRVQGIPRFPKTSMKLTSKIFETLPSPPIRPSNSRHSHWHLATIVTPAKAIGLGLLSISCSISFHFLLRTYKEHCS
jgi:hypothetical protein